MSILATNHLHKEYAVGKKRIPVINGIDVTFNKEELVAITGKSGSGKSTLLYLLSGLEKPTEGEVYYNETRIDNQGEKKLSKLRKNDFGFVFQSYNLLPDMSVWNNIAFPLELRGVRKKTIDRKIEEATSLLEIESLLKQKPYQLSGGEQQRVAIARALIIEPKIMFADEPTGNLDSKMGYKVIELFLEIHKKLKTTIVFVTHDKSIASNFKRQIIVSDGKIIEDR